MKPSSQILIVEDNYIFATELQNKLIGWDYNIVGIVDNFEESVNLLKSNTPNLILIDIGLKSDANGIDLAEEVLNEYNIPIIFITAYSDKSTIQKAKLTQPYGYIIKPIVDDVLRSTIEIVLYKKKIEKEREDSEQQFKQKLESLVASRTKKYLVTNKKLNDEIEVRKNAEMKFKSLIELAPDPIMVLDSDGLIVSINKVFFEFLNISREKDFSGKKYHEMKFMSDEIGLDKFQKSFESIKMGIKPKPFEFSFDSDEVGECFWWEAQIGGTKMDGVIKYFIIIIRDISEHKKHLINTKNGQRELKQYSLLVDEKNIALREILEQLQAEKTRINENIKANMNCIIKPLIEKLEMRCSDNEKLILKNLKISFDYLVSSIGIKLSNPVMDLTPKEIEICNMIKNDFSTKEIANTLNLSLRTVETHRYNIRKKINPNKNDFNLHSILLSMENSTK